MLAGKDSVRWGHLEERRRRQAVCNIPMTREEKDWDEAIVVGSWYLEIVVASACQAVY